MLKLPLHNVLLAAAALVVAAGTVGLGDSFTESLAITPSSGLACSP